MSRIGGDILEVSYNHPTIGSGVLYPKSGEESSYDLGGFRTDDDAQGTTGDGRTLRKITRNRWVFEVPIGWDMLLTDELDKLKKMAGDPIEAEWSISHLNGDVHRGTGAPVGDLVGNGGAATIPLKVSGGGEMQKV